MSNDIANIEEGLLSLWHMENWTDDDLRKHVPAVRKTITSLRARLAEAERIKDDVVTRLGEAHESLDTLRRNLTEAKSRLAEAEREIAEYEAANRDLVRRSDYWKAEAERLTMRRAREMRQFHHWHNDAMKEHERANAAEAALAKAREAMGKARIDVAAVAFHIDEHSFSLALGLCSQICAALAALAPEGETETPGFEPLGAEFEAVWDGNRSALYEEDRAALAPEGEPSGIAGLEGLESLRVWIWGQLERHDEHLAGVAPTFDLILNRIDQIKEGKP